MTTEPTPMLTPRERALLELKAKVAAAVDPESALTIDAGLVMGWIQEELQARGNGVYLSDREQENMNLFVEAYCNAKSHSNG